SDAAAKLAANSGIADVEADAVVALSEPVTPVRAAASAIPNPSASSVMHPATAILASWQWNMQAIHADAAWSAGKLGDPGVTVAILDSGIDYDGFDLNGLVDLTRSTPFMPADNLLRATFFPTRLDMSDFSGDGTHVAATVASKAVVFGGLTSRTTLMAVKVLGQDGSGPFSAILSGVLYATDHGADVANMSIGSEFLKAHGGSLTSLLNRVF